MKKIYAPLILFAFTVVFILSLWLSLGIHLEENILSLLPEDDGMVKNFRFIAEKFRLLDSLYIDIGAQGFSGQENKRLTKVADDLYSSLRDSGMFQSIHYRLEAQKSLEFLENMEEQKARLFSERDMAMLDRCLKKGEITRRLARAKRRLIGLSGSFLLEKIRRDPLDISAIFLDKLKKLNSRGVDVQIREGRLWSKDGKHLLMVAVPRCAPTDKDETENLLLFLQKTRNKLLEGSEGVHISYMGGHVATWDNTITIKKDIWHTMIAITVAIIILGMLFFRQKIFIVLVFFPASFGVVFALGVLALFSFRLSGIAFGCGSLFVGIAVDYGIHMLFHVDNFTGQDRCTKVGKTLIRPLIMGSATTMGAFVCLFFSSLPGQRDMGYVAVLGVFGAVIFTIFALKYLIPKRKEGQTKWVLPLNLYCERFLRWRNSNTPIVLTFGIVALMVSLFGVSKIHFDGDVNHLSYLNSQNSADEKLITRVWGGNLSSSALVVSGKTLEQALDTNDRLAKELKKLTDQGRVSSFSSLSPILPSRTNQKKNIRRWQSFWSKQRIAQVKSNFLEASAALDFSPGAFSPFFESLQRKNSPVGIEQFQNSGFEWLLQTRIVSTSDKTMILTTFTASDRKNLKKIASRLKAILPNSIFMDKKLFVEYTAHRVKSEFKKLCFAAALAIFLVLLVFFGRIELILVVISPVLLSSVMTLGILGFLGIPLDLFSILFIIFVFGVGIDFSIFLLSSALAQYRYEGEFLATSCGSVILCALTTLCAFVTLAFSTHPALFSIGITGAIGMSLSLFISITFIPIFANIILFREGRYGTPSLKKILGAIWAFVFLASLATLYNWLLRFLLRLRYWKKPEKRKSFARKYMHFVASGLLKSDPYLDSERIFIDAQLEKFAKPSIIVSNHLSAFDIMVILALPVEMIMIVKNWVWKAPFLGQLVRDGGYLLVGSESPENLLEKCRDYLKKGVSVMFFPEGTRSKDGGMGRFHKGAFEIALKANSPIIPVLLTNTQACIPRVSFWIGDHRAVIRALSPITPQNFDYTLGARKLGKYTKEKMLEHRQADWELAQNGKSFWHNIQGLYNYLGISVEICIAWKLRFDLIYRRVDKLVPKEGIVVDLGCGYGLSCNVLAWKSPQRQVIGVDWDKRKINIARRTAQACKNVEFTMQDIHEWEFPLANAIVMIDVFSGWNEEKQQSLIAKSCQRLKPGGIVIFRDSAIKHRFYLDTFKRQGLKLHSELNLKRTVVFALRKDS